VLPFSAPGLASRLYGATRVVGVEIDPMALQSCARNAAMNGLEMEMLLPVETTAPGHDSDGTLSWRREGSCLSLK
jgi:ribosomal protein L11 methylase PrmA